MDRRIAAGLGLPLIALAACAHDGGTEAQSYPSSLDVAVRDAGGATVATATAADRGGGVAVRVAAAGLAPGTYGVHVHAVGRCEPPGFESAGPHWNPTARQHGVQNPQGPHLGDLPNLQVGTDGAGSVEFTIAGARLAGGSNAMLDGDGAALMIHAGPDDYRTDPSGNSGARIACGVLD
jgi:Cu-Zn family superoxide dismutase